MDPRCGKCLFDPDKPYFEAWVQLYDADDTIFLEDIVDQEHGARPLYYAALCEFHELVEHLIRRVRVLEVVFMGLRYTRHRLQVISRLYGHCFGTVWAVGVDVRNYANRTPLRFASQSGHRDIVQCLINHGADVDSQEDDHNTPLNWAAHGGHVDVVRVLLEHNADVNSQDNYGRTPLHDALRGDDPNGDYPQVARLLLEHGANPNARDAFHRTPLHLPVVTTSNLEIKRILLEHGAEVDAKDCEGEIPLPVLLVEGQGEIARLPSEFRTGREQTYCHQSVDY